MYLFDEETKEFLKKLNANQVDYLIVGGFPVNNNQVCNSK
jgi:hypothetical protein